MIDTDKAIQTASSGACQVLSSLYKKGTFRGMVAEKELLDYLDGQFLDFLVNTETSLQQKHNLWTDFDQRCAALEQAVVLFDGMMGGFEAFQKTNSEMAQQALTDLNSLEKVGHFLIERCVLHLERFTAMERVLQRGVSRSPKP